MTTHGRIAASRSLPYHPRLIYGRIISKHCQLHNVVVQAQRSVAMTFRKLPRAPPFCYAYPCVLVSRVDTAQGRGQSARRSVGSRDRYPALSSHSRALGHNMQEPIRLATYAELRGTPPAFQRGVEPVCTVFLVVIYYPCTISLPGMAVADMCSVLGKGGRFAASKWGTSACATSRQAIASLSSALCARDLDSPLLQAVALPCAPTSACAVGKNEMLLKQQYRIPRSP